MAVFQADSASDIVERAFAWAEHRQRFKSLEDGSNDARQARIMYDARRRNVLEAIDWNFARHRAVPGAVVVNTPTPPGMPFAFSTPHDSLSVREVLADNTRLTWRREANVYTNSAPTQIAFTRDETNTALFVPSFTLGLEYLLAAQFAMVYARSVNRSNVMLDNYRRAMQEADQAEGAERSNDDAYERSPLDFALSSYNFEMPI